jgi:hypothetical protein
MRTWWLLLLCTAALGVAACGDDGDGMAGDDDDDDDMMVDLDLPADLPLAQVGENEDEDEFIDPDTAAPADFSCLNQARTTGDQIEVNVNVANGLDRNDVNDNTPYILRPDNTFGGDCASTDGTTNDSGNFTFMAAENALFGLRLCPTDESGFAQSIQYNLVASTMGTAPPPAPAGAVEASSSTSGILRLLPQTVDADPVNGGNGIISAALEDCNQDDVYGVVTRFFLPDGTLLRNGDTIGGASFALRYFDGIGAGSPTTGRTFTHTDGRYAGINVPGDANLLIGIYGVIEEGADPVLLSCEEVFVISSPTVQSPRLTVTTSRPLRDDSPTGCPVPM